MKTKLETAGAQAAAMTAGNQERIWTMGIRSQEKDQLRMEAKEAQEAAEFWRWMFFGNRSSGNICSDLLGVYDFSTGAVMIRCCLCGKKIPHGEIMVIKKDGNYLPAHWRETERKCRLTQQCQSAQRNNNLPTVYHKLKKGTEKWQKLILSVKEAKDHDKWLSARNMGIGGSDAGVIMGLNPYKSPFSFGWKRLDRLIRKISQTMNMCTGERCWKMQWQGVFLN